MHSLLKGPLSTAVELRNTAKRSGAIGLSGASVERLPCYRYIEVPMLSPVNRWSPHTSSIQIPMGPSSLQPEL